ncbi:MAG: hypothetical protein WC428_06685 [Candidatus Paceibacterota bacterium]|jgi:hypothetical protein
MSTNSYSGSALVVSWNGTVISGNQTTFDYTPTVDLYDQTSGADTHKKHLAGVKDSSASMSAYIQSGTNTGGTSLYSILAEGTPGTLKWQPEGTAAGKPYYSELAISNGVGFSYPYNNTVVASVSWQGDGARTEGTN